MNTKRALNSMGIIICFLFASVFSSCKDEQSEHKNENYTHVESDYICPMRCEGDKTYPESGNCPVCKMNLQLVEEELVQAVSPDKQVLSNQATVKLQSGNEGKTMKEQGFIVPAQNHNLSVAVRFGGRIDKLYVKFSNQYVNQGERIMDIYSPQLRTFQEEHLFLYKSSTENSLIQKSREKLSLFGLTESQITQLEKSGTVALTVSVYSPVNGYVFFGTQSIQDNTNIEKPSAMNAMGMQQNTSNEKAYASSASQIREGMYVNEGQTLFSVNQLKEVWALVSIANQNVNQIHENQSVEIVSENNPSKILNGKVALIEQTFEETRQRFARVRIVLPNSNNSLKINSLVTVYFSLGDKINPQVPSSAIYKTGLNAYVWVKTDSTRKGTGIFQARKVVTGTSNQGMTTVKSGLSPDEEIALQAGLMTDSETFLKEK